MTLTYDEQLAIEIRRLIVAYSGLPSPERVAAYVSACKYKAIGADRLARAVDRALATWEKSNPPPPAVVIAMAFGRAGESKAESEKRAHEAKVLRYYLERYSDADYFEFAKAFGEPASLALCDRMNVKPPDGATFRQPTREWCDAQRKASRDAAAAAFDRLRKRVEPLDDDEPANLLATEPPMSGEQIDAIAELGWGPP